MNVFRLFCWHKSPKALNKRFEGRKKIKALLTQERALIKPGRALLTPGRALITPGFTFLTPGKWITPANRALFTFRALFAWGLSLVIFRPQPKSVFLFNCVLCWTIWSLSEAILMSLRYFSNHLKFDSCFWSPVSRLTDVATEELNIYNLICEPFLLCFIRAVGMVYMQHAFM